MKQLLKELLCFFVGHNWTEFTSKRMGDYVYYADRKCGCCGEVEILKDSYAWRMEFLDKNGEAIK